MDLSTVANISGKGSVAFAINDQRKIAGTVLQNNNVYRGFIYDASSKNAISIQPLQGGTDSAACDINDNGLVVGWSGKGQFAQGYQQNFVITFDGTKSTKIAPWFYDAGDVAGSPETFLSINNNGQIIGSNFLAGYGVSRPVIYDPSSASPQFVEIPAPPGFTTVTIFKDGEANAINNQGYVVGAFNDLNTQQSLAFIWDSQNGTRDLNQLIPQNTGWHLTSAHDINDAGYIVGQGTYRNPGQLGGNPRPTLFLLTPQVFPIRHGAGLFELLVTLIIGVAQDGGGIVTLNGVPIPIGPWGALSASQQDILIGLATEEIAEAVNDPGGQRAIRLAALELVSERVNEMIKMLRKK